MLNKENGKATIDYEGQKYIIYTNKQLGAGSFGKVYLTDKIDESSNNVQKCATKIIDMFGQTKTDLEREILIISDIRGENILEALFAAQFDNEVYIITEYCDQGTLNDYQTKYQLSILQIMKLFKQILNGYKILRGKNIIHRDIKHDNILMQNGKPKIADFGLAKYSLESSQSNEHTLNKGTPASQSPQVFLGDNYGYKTDIYSLGVVLYKMIYNKYPNDIKKRKELNQFIGQLQKQPIKDVLKFDEKQDVIESIKRLLLNMLEFEENKRCDFKDLIQQVDQIIAELQNPKEQINKKILQETPGGDQNEILNNENNIQKMNCQYQIPYYTFNNNATINKIEQGKADQNFVQAPPPFSFRNAVYDGNQGNQKQMNQQMPQSNYFSTPGQQKQNNKQQNQQNVGNQQQFTNQQIKNNQNPFYQPNNPNFIKDQNLNQVGMQQNQFNQRQQQVFQKQLFIHQQNPFICQQNPNPQQIPQMQAPQKHFESNTIQKEIQNPGARGNSFNIPQMNAQLQAQQNEQKKVQQPQMLQQQIPQQQQQQYQNQQIQQKPCYQQPPWQPQYQQQQYQFQQQQQQQQQQQPQPQKQFQQNQQVQQPQHQQQQNQVQQQNQYQMNKQQFRQSLEFQNGVQNMPIPTTPQQHNQRQFQYFPQNQGNQVNMLNQPINYQFKQKKPNTNFNY